MWEAERAHACEPEKEGELRGTRVLPCLSVLASSRWFSQSLVEYLRPRLMIVWFLALTRCRRRGRGGRVDRFRPQLSVLTVLRVDNRLSGRRLPHCPTRICRILPY
jgi:hypothetical protein